MRLNQLRVFLAIVDSGSIHRAARALGVTQPAVTKSLRQLEEDLHVRLLDRTRHGIVPTFAGRAFIVRARAAQAELRKAEEELAQLAGERAGSVVFGVSHVALQILPETFSRFRQTFPDARVRIMEAASHIMFPMVRDETLDFLVGRWTGDKADPSMTVRPLIESEISVVGRVGHPLGKARSLGDLVHADWATILPPGVSGNTLEQIFTSAGLPCPKRIIHCESFAAVLVLVAGTDLLMAFPRIAHEPLRHGLQALPILRALPRHMISLITRADARHTPLAAAMIKVVTVVTRALARR